jgi:hypothetical protein
MVIPLSCALRSFSSTWSSCPSFYVHSFMILLIISCTKSCGLVAISPCHFHLHHMLLMPSLKHFTHGISNLVSLITKTKLGLSTGHLPGGDGATVIFSRECRSWCIALEWHWTGNRPRCGGAAALFIQRGISVFGHRLGGDGAPPLGWWCLSSDS